LANTPDVVLADEPTGNLDTKTGSEIIALLKSLNTEKGVTVICSTHDTKMLASSDRVCWIRDGRIEKVSTGSEFRVEEMEKDKLGR
jgi:putative ABC transport system ATP-binding protein